MEITALSSLSVNWTCLRNPENTHVYFQHSKCACTTYGSYFRERGWQRSGTNQIDWGNDIVFGHIRDPLIKQRKGIVEFFFYFPQFTHLVPTMLDSTFIDLLATIPYLDHHSMSLHDMLGDNAKLVKWIPIDTSLDHKKYTLDLLGIDDPKFLAAPALNRSTDAELQLYNQLTKVETPGQILRYIDYDSVLYEISKQLGN